MKHKTIIIILVLLFIVTLSGGILGFIKHKNMKTPEQPKEEIKVTYKYYLENEEVNQIPTNTEDSEIKYVFSKVICENGLQGDFDTTNWKFVPKENKTDTCSLYFVKNKYKVDFTVVNGISDENNPSYINRDEDAEFKLIPNEGYEFSKIECNNGVEGTWNSATSSVKLNAVMNDIACKVVFNVKVLKAEVIVGNGTGMNSEQANYGGKISFIVTPNSGYGNPTITCTNNQTAVWDNNELVIEKLTDNTRCTVTFKKTSAITHTLKINNISDFPNISIVNGDASIRIEDGATASITLSSSDGKVPKLTCNEVPNKDMEGDYYKFTFIVKKDITCTLGVE